MDHPRVWASAAGGCPPWIFIHDKDRVDRGSIVLFWVCFPLPPTPENFSADALA